MEFESGISEYREFYAPNIPDALTSDFFTLDTTVGYFPTLRMNDMYVPAGNAKPYCSSGVKPDAKKQQRANDESNAEYFCWGLQPCS